LDDSLDSKSNWAKK